MPEITKSDASGYKRMGRSGLKWHRMGVVEKQVLRLSNANCAAESHLNFELFLVFRRLVKSAMTQKYPLIKR